MFPHSNITENRRKEKQQTSLWKRTSRAVTDLVMESNSCHDGNVDALILCSLRVDSRNEASFQLEVDAVGREIAGIHHAESPCIS